MQPSRRVVVGLAIMLAVGLSGSSCDFGSTSAVSKSFEGAKTDPTLLRAFLNDFPKGADLHNHLSGAIYAEDIIPLAAQQRQCFDAATQSIVEPPCGAGTRPIRDALTDRTFDDEVIDALSMRHFVPEQSPQVNSGYGQFFATFGRFDAAVNDSNLAEQLTAAKKIAAADNVGYVEYMATPNGSAIAALGARVGLRRTFGATLAALQRGGLKRQVQIARNSIRRGEVRFDRANGCATPKAAPQCAVASTFLYQVIRELPPAQVFAQFAVGFELARTDPKFVGINLVAPENGPVALRDYDLQMKMIEFLNSTGSAIKIALHAGELAQGLVNQPVLGTHIRKAMKAGAIRIGHGTDIAFDENPAELMAQMKATKTTVEIQLTSSEQILGIDGTDHPFPTYLANGVPTVLSTDDQGVSRIDLTNQYQLAVERYGLTYEQLVTISRQGLESSFLGGRSLWVDGVGSSAVSECAADANQPAQSASITPLTARPTISASSSPSSSGFGQGGISGECQAFIKQSARASAQLNLERRLAAFAHDAPVLYTKVAATQSKSAGSTG